LKANPDPNYVSTSYAERNNLQNALALADAPHECLFKEDREPRARDGAAALHALAGPGLPAQYDPAAGKGLGMKIIQSLVNQVGGTLQFAPGDDGRGTSATVTFELQP
jgi:hypothetical protein